MSTILQKLMDTKIAPAKLVERIRKTESGALAKQLGAIAYSTYTSDQKTIVGGCCEVNGEEAIKKVFYAAAEMLEQQAMREVLEREFR
jgi:hypothetical protein